VWIGTFRVDFLILPKNKNQKKLIIECDGATYHGSTEAYAYDYFRMKQLEENGYIVHKIWSSNWWDEEEYSQELKKVKNLLEEYDQPPTEGSRFYDTPEQPKEPEVTKEIRKLIQNDIEQENIMTGFTTDSVSDEEIEDMIEMKSATDPLRLKPVTKNVELTTDLNRQSSLFSSDVDISTNKDVWFKLSHWGKETGNFNGFQNRACYSLGSYIEKHKKLTAKQESYGKKLFECAVEKGFVYSNI
jgi:hypothetical protein